jgi:23S rRNA (cytosine1962-C5)-methyltransferase
VAQYAKEATVLDLCSNTGGFTLQALLSGAKHVTAVDSSAGALQQLQENARHTCASAVSRLECKQVELVEALETFAKQGRLFDMIILDPPKLAPKRSDVPAAMRAYKDFNRRALRCLAPGGYLASFSCSSAISGADLLMAISWAALDAGVTLFKLENLSQPMDHPVNLFCPESEYLKGFIFEREVSN